MPASYFRVTPPSIRTDHLKAISALKDTDMSLSVDIKSKLSDGRRLVTYIRPKDKVREEAREGGSEGNDGAKG